MNMLQTFEITIPVLNEEVELETNIRKIGGYLSAHYPSDRWRLRIADNGSTDHTPNIAKRLEAELPWVSYLRLEKKGVGLALKTSWESASTDVVGYFDLDLATDMEHLQQALEALTNGADLVYGSRLARGAKVVGRSLKREITSRVFNLLLRLYLGVRVSDGMCGFKFLRRDRLEELRRFGAVSDGWFFSTELLVVGTWRKMKLHELPVRWTDSSDSRVKIFSLARQYLKAMRVLRKNRQAILVDESPHV